MARTKLTPAVHNAIVAMVGNGAFVERACEAAGISKSTYYSWLKLAGDPEADPRYKTFMDATTQARAEFENRMVSVVMEAAPDDWRSASWLLERLFPTRYSNMRKVEITGAEGGPITLAGLEALLKLDAPEDGDG